MEGKSNKDTRVWVKLLLFCLKLIVLIWFGGESYKEGFQQMSQTNWTVPFVLFKEEVVRIGLRISAKSAVVLL